MGADTVGKMTSNPSVEEVMDALEKIGATDVEQISGRIEYTNKEKESHYYGRIQFNYRFGEDIQTRILFFNQKGRDLEYEAPPHVYSDYMNLSLGSNDCAIEIMTKLAERFSGYVIPDDGADQDAEDFAVLYEGEGGSIFDKETTELFSALRDTIPTLKDRMKVIDALAKNRDTVMRYLDSRNS